MIMYRMMINTCLSYVTRICNLIAYAYVCVCAPGRRDRKKKIFHVRHSILLFLNLSFKFVNSGTDSHVTHVSIVVDCHFSRGGKRAFMNDVARQSLLAEAFSALREILSRGSVRHRQHTGYQFTSLSG